jgi:hypothetical protein
MSATGSGGGCVPKADRVEIFMEDGVEVVSNGIAPNVRPGLRNS